MEWDEMQVLALKEGGVGLRFECHGHDCKCGLARFLGLPAEDAAQRTVREIEVRHLRKRARFSSGRLADRSWRASPQQVQLDGAPSRTGQRSGLG